ncbi:MAG: hypothetical protein B7Z55_14840 [Planctomycetales bacterium 12-60-4]|nr:MAG: hypothetical protein B7Z55_14840 [Planctomycetales bacterium 12-60-4]
MPALESSPPNPRHGLRREAIVQSLIGDIFHGRISAGQHLVTQELAERFGVSHTPIREALIALGGVGLLTLQPNRGAVVRWISEREVREICRVRRALECEAVRGACGRISTLSLKALRRDFGKLQSAQGRNGDKAIGRARELDNDLHDLIAQSADNAFLANELSRLKLLFRGLRDVSWEHDRVHHEFDRLAEESREHAAIVDALLSGARRAAMTAMSRHILSGMVYCARALPNAADATPRRRPAKPITPTTSTSEVTT